MTPADLERVMEIAAAGGGGAHAPRWPRAAWLAALDPDATQRRIALVAEEPRTNALIGFAVASLLHAQAELETIAVADQSRRRGVARRLFAVLVAELTSAQVREMMLEVRAGNLPALALYRSLGFRKCGRRPRYYADPEEDAVLMTLPIR
jgi:ribosomal-protein-alanine acetyltransferase